MKCYEFLSRIHRGGPCGQGWLPWGVTYRGRRDVESRGAGPAMGAILEGASGRQHDSLHALGRGAPRPALRRLRGIAPLVAGGARGLLGGHLGVLRGARLARVRAGARLAHDARRAVVRGRGAQLRREHAAARSAPRRCGGAARLRAASPARAHMGRADRAGGKRRRRPARAGRWARAIGWWHTCPTFPRRSSRSWRTRASARCGRAPLPSSARAA